MIQVGIGERYAEKVASKWVPMAELPAVIYYPANGESGEPRSEAAFRVQTHAIRIGENEVEISKRLVFNLLVPIQDKKLSGARLRSGTCDAIDRHRAPAHSPNPVEDDDHHQLTRAQQMHHIMNPTSEFLTSQSESRQRSLASNCLFSHTGRNRSSRHAKHSSCSMPRYCISSTLANTNPHRHHGECPAPESGQQDFEEVRLSGGPHKAKDKTKLSNRNDHLTMPAPDDKPSREQLTKLTGNWDNCATIQPNNLRYKSLSNWSYNTVVGSGHDCRFFYAPLVSAIKKTPQLKELGVEAPDAQWGQHVYLREWDEEKFLHSLRKAEDTPLDELEPEGNRAVIYCSTTDPYHVIRHPDLKTQSKLADHASYLVRRSLELIRDESTLNVRILTRSPLARRDFDLYQSFGHRLVFGMSLPTLSSDLAKIYEPHAPAPSQRLKTLQEAKEAGLHVYVAIADTYPNEKGPSLRDTITAVRDLNPITVFHEPINIRGENVRRIEEHARSFEVTMKTDVFETRESWADHALGSMYTAEIIAEDLGMTDCLHLLPDKSLGSKWMLKRFSDPQEQLDWLNFWWDRVSEWPHDA